MIRYPAGHVPQRAGIYTRISEILPGTEDIYAGTDRQETDCRKLGEYKGWKVSKVYTDNNVSAYKKNIIRPEWVKMLADLESGVIDGIIAYDLDRLARQPKDLNDLISIIENTNAPNAVFTGDVDLSTDNGKMVAGILVNIARKSSADTARRVSRQKIQRAEQAKPPISRNRTYGYVHDFSAIMPDEAALLREARSRLLAGESLHALCKEFNANGRLPYSGKPWRSQNLSNMLKNPSHAGFRTYKKEIAAEGTWPKIFTKEEHEEIVEHLKGNEPYSRNTARKHLLASILVCDLCGASLGGKAPSYICNANRGGCGKIVRNMETLDKFFIALTYAVLKKEMGALPQLDIEDTSGTEIAALENDIIEAREARKAGLITLADFIDIRKDADSKIKALRKNREKQVKLPVDDAEAFLTADVDKQRATIKRIFNVVGVKPTGAKGTRFHPSQLTGPYFDSEDNN